MSLNKIVLSTEGKALKKIQMHENEESKKHEKWRAKLPLFFSVMFQYILGK